jgi:hypothetical protein
VRCDVPFIISWPGKFREGAHHDGVISLVDFAPTVLDMANVPIPEGQVPPIREAPDAPQAWPGRSLLPLVTNASGEIGVLHDPDTTALVEDDQDYLGFRMRTLVTKRYRLTAYSGQPYGELFDLQEDPNESLGRIIATFRDTVKASETHGDFVAWVGSYDDLVHGRDGQYRVRLLENHSKPGDTGYAGLELLPDGTFVSTTYCVLSQGEQPLVVCIRFTLEEIDAMLH